MRAILACVFPLAPMSAAIRVLTVLLLALPLVLLSLGAGDDRAALSAVAASLLALYAWVWLWWRPSGFEVDNGALRVCFPTRVRTFPRDALGRARVMDRASVRRELGFAVRIGVGGLWGVFGLLWTRRRGLVEVWISRGDGFVWVERPRGRPLLLTPSEPRRLVEALGAG